MMFPTIPIVWVLVQSGPDPSSLIGWLQSAALATIVVAFIMGWIVPKPTHDQSIAREKAQNERIDRLLEQQDERAAIVADALKVLQDRSNSAPRRG